VNQLGHPDIEFDYQNKHWRIEVEFAHPEKQAFEIKKEDVEATRPLSDLDAGYLAIFDCNYPVHWILVDTRNVVFEGLGFHPLGKLDSIGDRSLSSACTEWSARFLIENRSKIISKRYPGLVSEYLFPD
jgi:hypothetical protein